MGHTAYSPDQLEQLASDIKSWGNDLGFQEVRICDADLTQAGNRLKSWLAKEYQGTMDWMSSHGDMRYTPDQLLPETIRIISARMDYLPESSNMIAVLKNDNKAYISRYALGGDYHKLIRKRLAALAKKIIQKIPAAKTRPFVDSAPVMEKAVAEKAGLGWVGKNTLLLNSKAGSWFFLGEIFTNLPLPIDKPEELDQCGKCQACLTVCPTNAFPQPYVLDARRCISYLTIEHKGSIPEQFRTAMGNRVFGCDDCQIICPWNREAPISKEPRFTARHKLEEEELVNLFNWDEATFLKNTEGSPIRRIGYHNWLRNLAVGLGNAPTSEAVLQALQNKLHDCIELVREHVEWALEQHKHPRKVSQKLTPQIRNNDL